MIDLLMQLLKVREPMKRDRSIIRIMLRQLQFHLFADDIDFIELGRLLLELQCQFINLFFILLLFLYEINVLLFHFILHFLNLSFQR